MNHPKSVESRGVLLSVVEIGGYPNLTPLYERAGYEVVTARSVRKALGMLRKVQPRIVVAEFNFQSHFRDRTSNLESLLAAVQRLPDTKVIVFYEREYGHQLEKLRARFQISWAFAYPIDVYQLEERLNPASLGNPSLREK